MSAYPAPMVRKSPWVVVAALAVAACGGGNGGSSTPTSTMPAPSALTYPSPQTFTAGSAITPLAPTVTGSVTNYTVSPALPAGVVLNAASGQISGTPTAPATIASYTITAHNSGGSTSFSMTITVNPPLFWLEPSTSTTMAVGQSIELFAALKGSQTDAFPNYLDQTQVAWQSSQPAVANVNANGSVTGLSAGTTTINATYQTHSYRLTVQVAGTWTQRNVAVTGQGTRSYSIYVPSPVSSSARPLLLALHGGGGTATIQASTSLLGKFAQEQGIYVAFLEGSGVVQTFNAGSCCGSARTQNIDDVQFVRSVLDHIQANYSVDATKVFATGFSNGGMMSHRLACDLSDRIAGIAAVGGASGQFDRTLTQYYACNPTRRIPVLHIHATNDRNYPYAGGAGEGVSSTDFYPVDATIADWRIRNNVTAQVTVQQVTATTACYRYSSAADTSLSSAPVVLCRVNPTDVYDAASGIVFGGGHSWPGGVRSPAASSDTPAADFNANAYLWAFLNP